jgi:hypothetical protein
VKGTIQIRDVVFFYFINLFGAFHSKRSSCASQYIQIYLFSWQLPIIFTNILYSVKSSWELMFFVYTTCRIEIKLYLLYLQKQIKYHVHVFNAVTNSELTELVPVFTIWPALPTSVKKVNTLFKNVWRTWGPALPTLLADLMIFCPLGPIDVFQKLWLSISLLGTGTLVQVGGTSLLCCFHHICIRFVLVTLCCIVYLNTEKTGPLLLGWHHLNSDFQAFWNLAKYLVFFAAAVLVRWVHTCTFQHFCGFSIPYWNLVFK